MTHPAGSLGNAVVSKCDRPGHGGSHCARLASNEEGDYREHMRDMHHRQAGRDAGRMHENVTFRILGAEPRRLQRRGRLVQQPDGLAWKVTGIGIKLTAEPKQSKPDPLEVGRLNGADDLLGLIDEVRQVTRSLAQAVS